MIIKRCDRCIGGMMELRPDEDRSYQWVCLNCGHIEYVNHTPEPKPEDNRGRKGDAVLFIKKRSE